MARTISEIEASIEQRLNASFELSTSAAAEWRMWTHCVAYCIHLFELTLDIFKKEMDDDAKREIAGSLTWYRRKCFDFQNGHELRFSTVTGFLEYETLDEEAQVVKVASVSVSDTNTLVIRVATLDNNGETVPLASQQTQNFKDYIDAIKFAGTKTQVISTDADLVRYSIQVWYDPAYPAESVRANVLASLTAFRTSQDFGGIIYRHEILEAVTSVAGVVTAKIVSLSRKGSEDSSWTDIDTASRLHAGYFNYDMGHCTLTLISNNEL